MDQESFSPSVLAGIRVLDLTRVRSCPRAVRQLADVIKIELPVSLEADGELGASRDMPNSQNLHRNKRSMTLNLKDQDGHTLFMKLVEKSVVVV
jgi:crotonobetainyl-CoA:carnitine CoA-transferase CaiB-like acyl-CoA transferase